MDLDKVLAQLRAELASLNSAIESLERLRTEGKRRGRPPKNPDTVRKSDEEPPQSA